MSIIEANGEFLYLKTYIDNDHDNSADAGEFFFTLGFIGFIVYLFMPKIKKLKYFKNNSINLLIIGILCMSKYNAN